MPLLLLTQPPQPPPLTPPVSLLCTQANDYWNDAYPRNAVLEFSRDRKSMSTLCGLSAGGGGKSPARGRSPAKSPARSKSPAKAKSPARAKSPAKKTTGDATDANMLYVKGAPESVVARCNYARLANGTKVAMSEKDRAAVLKTVAEMAARPLRVLAMAVKEDVGPLATYDGPAHPSQKLLTNPAKFGALEDRPPTHAATASTASPLCYQPNRPPSLHLQARSRTTSSSSASAASRTRRGPR